MKIHQINKIPTSMVLHPYPSNSLISNYFHRTLDETL